MNDLTIRYVGVFAQSFAAFVAISILFGRVYHLSYFDALGIPATEFALGLTEYSVASPEVAVFAIGFSTIIGIYFLYPWHSMSVASFRWIGLILGVVLYVSGAAPLIDQFIYVVIRSDLDMMLITVLFLFKPALMFFGLAIVNAVLPLFLFQDERAVLLRRAFMPLFLVLHIGLSVWLLSEFSSTVGRVDALRTSANAPVARVEIASDHADGSPDRSDEQNNMLKSGYFGVVMVGEKFVYLRPAPNCKLAEERLHALPVEDVKEIMYVPN